VATFYKGPKTKRRRIMKPEQAEVMRVALIFLLERVATEEEDHNERGKTLVLLEELRNS
jgi:hypothetical protein